MKEAYKQIAIGILGDYRITSRTSIEEVKEKLTNLYKTKTHNKAEEEIKKQVSYYLQMILRVKHISHDFTKLSKKQITLLQKIKYF